jgi:molybdate transport system substrate-binding protein
MRFSGFPGLMAVFLGSIAAANAADLRVVSPGFVYNSALKDLALEFTKETGIKVTVSEDGMNTIVNNIKTATPAADVIVLPVDLIDTLDLDGGLVAGTYTPVGRDEVGLAVRAGAPHPDISTVANLAAALKSAQAVEVNDPKAGTMQGVIIGELLGRPEFAGVHSVPVARGEGAAALARGEGDMALQLIPEIYNKKGIELVGPLPRELGVHMDAIAAVSARSTDPKDALAFIRYITRPAAHDAWKAKGLNPF